VDMLSSAKSNENRTASLISDMDHLEIAISKLQEMLERISKYVDSVVVSIKNHDETTMY
jgi:translation initiation factor 3 subunit F